MIFRRLPLHGMLHRIGSGTLVCLSLLASASHACAEQIEARLQNGLSISASYHKGNPSATAVLILHGFLQTAHSEPMNSLAANLASRGYTTLLPTLSLHINHRKQSSPCESMHTHTVEQDLAEIDYWFKWLHTRGYSKITLIGFSSTGNFESLLYGKQQAHPALNHLILISLNPMMSGHQSPRQAKAAFKPQNLHRARNPQMYTLGYCKGNYAATPASFASYAAFDENRILDLIRGNAKPLDLVFGAADTILPDNWIARIESLKSSAAINIIPDANHFFEGTTEFDLSEQVETLLRRNATQS